MTGDKENLNKKPARSVAKLGFRAFIVGIFIIGAVILANGLWTKGKAILAQVLLNQAFIASVEKPVKPWPWADIHPMARISAPSLDQSNIVLSNVSGEALAFGPAHLAETAFPGSNGTVVLAAHRDTHFNWIGGLNIGDEIILDMPNGDRIYYTIRRSWVAPFDASGIDADSEEKLIALTSCWPLDGSVRGDQCYIVEGVESKVHRQDRDLSI